MIIYCTGDLFLSKAKCLAHGCNSKGVMGAGIAKGFKSKYKEMYYEYAKWCGLGWIRPGMNFVYYSTEWDNTVVNMITQKEFYDARIEHIRECCHRIVAGKEVIDYGQKSGPLEIESLAMPVIGSGLGALKVEEVKNVLEEVFSDASFPVFIYDKYKLNERSEEEIEFFEG